MVLVLGDARIFRDEDIALRGRGDVRLARLVAIGCSVGRLLDYLARGGAPFRRLETILEDGHHWRCVASQQVWLFLAAASSMKTRGAPLGPRRQRPQQQRF